MSRSAALLGLLAVTAAPAWAQTPPDAGQLLEQTRPGARPALPSQTAPRIIEAPVRPTVTMPEGITVAVTGFRISGATSFSAETLSDLVKPWVGRRLDIAGLNEAAGAITRHYQSAGHLLSYAYLPAQRVADGVIELAVLEGRLESVQIVSAQDARLRDEVVQAHTAGLADKPPLLQAEVERALLLLNDIPGVAARAAFAPGADTGGAEMLVSVAEDEPLAVSAEFNNHGSRSTGEYRAGISLRLNDLFGWGDSSTAHALVSNKGSLVSGSLGTRVPLGGQGWALGASLSRLSYQLAGDFKQLGASGSADTAGLEFSYPLLRGVDTNLNVKAGYEYRRLQDDLLLIGSRNAKHNEVFDLVFAFDRRGSWGGVSAGSLGLLAGDLKILDEQRRAQDAAGLRTARAYRKLSLQLAHQQPLGGPWSAYLRAAGQATGGNVDSSEKLALGGPAAVRAYAPGEASVDQGGIASLELRLAQDYLGGNLVWSLFHDHGQGLVNRLPLPGVGGNEARLSGSGLAVQWSGGDYGLSASLAWRGGRLPSAEGGDARPRLFVQMSVTP